MPLAISSPSTLTLLNYPHPVRAASSPSRKPLHPCQRCASEFNTLQQLRLHGAAAHFCCQKCPEPGEPFASIQLLRQHLFQRHTVKLAPSTTTTTAAVRPTPHNRASSNVHSVQCVKCPMSFRARQSLLDHAKFCRGGAARGRVAPRPTDVRMHGFLLRCLPCNIGFTGAGPLSLHRHDRHRLSLAMPWSPTNNRRIARPDSIVQKHSTAACAPKVIHPVAKEKPIIAQAEETASPNDDDDLSDATSGESESEEEEIDDPVERLSLRDVRLLGNTGEARNILSVIV